MKKIKVLQFGIAAILLLCAVLSGCEKRYSITKKQWMQIYTDGYSCGYNNAREQCKKYRQINDTTLIFDYTNYDTCRIIDSLEKSGLYFK